MKGFLAFSETDCEHCFDLPGYFILRMYIWNGGKIHRVCTMDHLSGAMWIWICLIMTSS